METLVGLVSTPNLAYVLLVLGIYGIIFEIMNPGVGAPGVFGALCLIFAFTGMQNLPVNYIGLIFMLAGVLLTAGEAFIPSFGILSICGAVSFALGGYHLVERDLSGIGVDLWLIAIITILNLAVVFAIMSVYLHTRKSPIAVGSEAIKGSRGTVISWEKNKGVVAASGSRWDAISESEQEWEKDDHVSIKDMDGLKLIVEPYKKPEKGEK